ncbi:hypothetical protein C1646_711757 [Rhizophagus diaphanus]|nr:hypothetical protein C1646_711757 [Rhizophagus diaphanus] [Rhizophagus sp. MUCL 43196]
MIFNQVAISISNNLHQNVKKWYTTYICMYESTWPKLLYSDFWEKPVSEWGGIENWELFYKKNTTRKMVQSSHNSLRLELEVLIKYGDNGQKLGRRLMP